MTESNLSPQPWDWPGPRVLLERPYGVDLTARVDALRRAGYAVAVCPGPTGEDRCPLAHDLGCAAAQGADVVVSSLGFATPAAREALAALRTQLPSVRVLVEADPEDAAAWPELVDGTEILPGPVSPERLVDEVTRLLDRQAGGRA